MKKIVSKVKIKRKLWKVFSEFIRRRDEGKCFTCSTQKDYKEMDAGHYIPTSICGEYLYFNEREVNCQCRACNRFKHGNLTEYARRLVKKYGAGILEELNNIKKEGKTMPATEMLKKVEYYKNEISKLTEEVV